MPDKTSDRRTIRTKRMLRQALVSLIEEKGLDGITVSDLTTRAEINRGTFYLHYKDVYDLIEQLQKEMLDGLAAIASEIEFTDMVQYGSQGEPYPGLVSIFEYWSRHSDFCGAMLGPKGDPSFARSVKEMMKEKIYNKLAVVTPTQPDNQTVVPREYILAYMTSANVGILQHWFESGLPQTPREVATIMTRLVSHGPITALGFHRN